MSTFAARHIEPEVQKAIVRKIKALNRQNLNGDDQFTGESSEILEPAELNNPIGYHMVRNTFCRLSVDISVQGDDEPNVLFLSSYITPGSERYGKKSQANRHLTFNKSPFTNDKDFIWRGESGITSVQVNQKSFFVKELTVNFACPDPNDFERIIKPAFLQHGRFMVLEFGWGISDKVKNSFKDVNKKNMTKYMEELRDRNSKSIDSYQAECGVVTNYKYDVNEQGGYTGTITIISRGDNVLNQAVNNVDSEESVTKFEPIKSQELQSKAKEITTTFKETIEKLTEYVNATINKSVGIVELASSEPTSNLGTRGGNYYFYNGAMRTISQAGNQPITKTYVSWGWFEDHILNSFFKIDVETSDGAKIPFQEFRSVSTAEKIFGDDITESKKLVANRCNNVKGLYSLGCSDIILPGQGFPPSVISRTIEEMQKAIDKHNKTREETLFGVYLPVLSDVANAFKNATGAINQLDLGFGSIQSFANSETFTDFVWLGDNYVENINDSVESYNTMKQAVKAQGQIRDTAKAIRTFAAIDKEFKPFGNPENGEGIIRNIVFETEYLKSHFEGINSIQEGISSLFTDVSGKYGGFFKFGLCQDEDNNGRVGVIDLNYQNDIEKSPELLSDKTKLNFTKYIEGDRALSQKRMWEFGLFSKDSIIKDFSFSLKLTQQAATLALYGAGNSGRFVNSSGLSDLGIERFTALGQAELYKKLHPNATGSLAEEKNQSQKVITKFRTPLFDEVEIGPNQPDSLGTMTSEYEKREGFIDELIDANSIYDFNVLDSIKNSTKDISDEHKSDDSAVDFGVGYDSEGGLNPTSKRKMLASINYSDISGEMSNYQLNKTIIPIELDMTIDGIGGLRPGNLFRVDYLPKIYRKYTYFQIFSINHSITTSGWSTAINAKMKLDFPKMITDGLIEIKSLEEAKEEAQIQKLIETLETPVSILKLQESTEQKAFGGLSEEAKEGIKKLEKESYGWSEEETEIRYAINNDTTLVDTIKGLVNDGVPLDQAARAYVETTFTKEINQFSVVDRRRNEFISKYSTVVANKYNGKNILNPLPNDSKFNEDGTPRGDTTIAVDEYNPNLEQEFEVEETILENLETYEQTNETFVETNEENNDKVELRVDDTDVYTENGGVKTNKKTTNVNVKKVPITPPLSTQSAPGRIPTNIEEVTAKYGSMINLSTQYIDNNYVYKIGPFEVSKEEFDAVNRIKSESFNVSFDELFG